MSGKLHMNFGKEKMESGTQWSNSPDGIKGTLIASGKRLRRKLLRLCHLVLLSLGLLVLGLLSLGRLKLLMVGRDERMCEGLFRRLLQQRHGKLYITQNVN